MAIGITGKFKPEGDYPLMDAEDIEMPDGTRLSEIEAYISGMFVPMTQAEYDALVSAGTVDPNKYYMIVGDGE